MTATLVFTLGDILWSILLALLVGAFFGRMIAKEARQFFRPGVGELMHRESAKIGAQVLRSMGLSKARLEDFETEGRLLVDDETLTNAAEGGANTMPTRQGKPATVTGPTPVTTSADAETHSEN